MLPRDGALRELFWRGVIAAAAALRLAQARALAATVGRLQSRDEAGYRKSVYRVANRRTWSETPGLVKLPEEWFKTSPIVSVRRLGLELELDLRDNLQRTLYYTGTYEPAVIRFFHQELQAEDVFLDGGAHIGVHALAVARRLRELGAGGVVAFEPMSDSAEKIRANAARNGLEVQVVEAALGSSAGAAELFSEPDYDAADTGVRSQYAAGEAVGRVPVTTLDAWTVGAGLERLDLIKLDVEGAELAALEGMSESLRLFRPRALVVEIKDAVLERAGVQAAEVRDLLHAFGYLPTGDVLFSSNEVFRRS